MRARRRLAASSPHDREHEDDNPGNSRRSPRASRLQHPSVEPVGRGRDEIARRSRAEHHDLLGRSLAADAVACLACTGPRTRR